MKAPLFAAAIVLWAGVAAAHKPSDSYLVLRPEGRAVAARWDVALRDLEQAIGIDTDGDGAITWGEVRARRDAIAAYALARLEVAAAGDPCRAGAAELRIAHHTDGAYAALDVAFTCPRPVDDLRLRYGLFFEFDPQHRGVLRVETAGEVQTAVFTVDAPRQQVVLRADGTPSSGWGFGRDGVRVLWTAPHHSLFLIGLLLAAARPRRRGGPATPAPPALAGALQVAAAIAVAESIGLSLAAVGWVQVPAPMVQTGIALSVAVALLDAARPLLTRGRWLFGFAFGLLHGVAFAGALAARVPVTSLVTALAGFTAGVVGGQLALAAGILPLTDLAYRCAAERGRAFGNMQAGPRLGPFLRRSSTG